MNTFRFSQSELIFMIIHTGIDNIAECLVSSCLPFFHLCSHNILLILLFNTYFTYQLSRLFNLLMRLVSFIFASSMAPREFLAHNRYLTDIYWKERKGEENCGAKSWDIPLLVIQQDQLLLLNMEWHVERRKSGKPYWLIFNKVLQEALVQPDSLLEGDKVGEVRQLR